ncbi:hypothetical protein DSECCO2_640500 [anaerobic digester metagenome]
MGCLLDEPVHPHELTVEGVDHLPLRDRLVCPGGGYIVGNPGVEPGDRPAERRPLRRDDADVVRGKRLAEGAGVERLHILVLHAADPLVAPRVDLPCLHKHPLDLLPIGDERHLDRVDVIRELRLEFVGKQRPDIPDPDAFCHRFL